MIKYKLDYQNTIKITDEREVVYTISKKHRGHNKEKSYWSIKMPREIALFRYALKDGYEDKANYTAWNLNIVKGDKGQVPMSPNPDKVRLNCYYYRHYSFIKDIQMILCTVLGKKMEYAGETI